MFATALLLGSLLGASPELDEGRLASSAQKYDQALEPLRRAGEDAAAPLAERAEAYALLARAQLALGHAELAKQAWLSLLSLAPGAPEPKGSPKVRASFQDAKASKFPPRFVQLSRTQSSGDVLEAALLNPWSVPVRVELWEAAGEGEFQSKPLTVAADRVVTALRPGSKNYLRVVGADGVLLASLGAPAEPIAGPPALVSDVPRAPPPPLVLISDKPTEVSAAPAVRPGLSGRGLFGVVLASVGLAAMIIGGILAGLGSNELSQGNGWPLNNLDYDVAQQDLQSGPQKLVAGGITGGLGLGLAIAGAVLFFTSSSGQPSPP